MDKRNIYRSGIVDKLTISDFRTIGIGSHLLGDSGFIRREATETFFSSPVSCCGGFGPELLSRFQTGPGCLHQTGERAGRQEQGCIR